MLHSREGQAVFKGEPEDGRQMALGGQRNVQKAYDASAWQKGAGFNLDNQAEKAGLQKRGENRDFAIYANPTTGEHLTIHKPSDRFAYDSPQMPSPKQGYVEDIGAVLQPKQKGQNGGAQQGQGPNPSQVHSAVENQDGSFSVIQSHATADKANASPAGTHVIQSGKDGSFTATPKAGGTAVPVDPTQIHTPKAIAKGETDSILEGNGG